MKKRREALIAAMKDIIYCVKKGIETVTRVSA